MPFSRVAQLPPATRWLDLLPAPPGRLRPCPAPHGVGPTRFCSFRPSCRLGVPKYRMGSSPVSLPHPPPVAAARVAPAVPYSRASAAGARRLRGSRLLLPLPQAPQAVDPGGAGVCGRPCGRGACGLMAAAGGSQASVLPCSSFFLVRCRVVLVLVCLCVLRVCVCVCKGKGEGQRVRGAHHTASMLRKMTRAPESPL